MNKLVDTHTLVNRLIKETLREKPPFLCSEFSGVHCINPTCCRYILQSGHGHYKCTHFLIFLLKILKDCDNLISLGTRNEIEFTLCPCNMSIRRKLYRREAGTNISFKMGGEKPCKKNPFKKGRDYAFYKRDYKGDTIKLLPFYMTDFLFTEL